MNSLAENHYNALPQNITHDQLISMSRFNDFLYDQNNIKSHHIPELDLTIKYISKIPKEIAIASYVERFKINNDNTYYNISTFNEQFKTGDEVTLNYQDFSGDEYYIRGNITDIDINTDNITINNNNPLFTPRHYEFNNGSSSYSMIFLKHGFFEIKRIKTSMIKKE